MTETSPLRNLDKLKHTFDKLFDEIGKVIVGQKSVVEHVLVAILCEGNALLSDNHFPDQQDQIGRAHV